MYSVLGAGGFVGSAVCRYLDAAGEPYVPIRRRDYEAWVGKPTDVLVNCAGNARRFWADEHPLDDFAATVGVTIRSLADLPARLYVQISSVDVYEHAEDPFRNDEGATIVPERLGPYGLHKWIAETLVRRYSPTWLVLRLGGLVGEGLKKNPVYDAETGVPLRLTPDSELGFIDTADVARVISELVGRGIRNDVFNVCGTGVVRMDELASLAGRSVAFAPDGERQAYRVTNAKIRALMPIPSSRDAVTRHFARRRSGVS